MGDCLFHAVSAFRGYIFAVVLGEVIYPTCILLSAYEVRVDLCPNGSRQKNGGQAPMHIYLHRFFS